MHHWKYHWLYLAVASHWLHLTDCTSLNATHWMQLNVAFHWMHLTVAAHWMHLTECTTESTTDCTLLQPLTDCTSLNATQCSLSLNAPHRSLSDQLCSETSNPRLSYQSTQHFPFQSIKPPQHKCGCTGSPTSCWGYLNSRLSKHSYTHLFHPTAQITTTQMQFHRLANQL